MCFLQSCKNAKHIRNVVRMVKNNSTALIWTGQNKFMPGSERSALLSVNDRFYIPSLVNCPAHYPTQAWQQGPTIHMRTPRPLVYRRTIVRCAITLVAQYPISNFRDTLQADGLRQFPVEGDRGLSIWIKRKCQYSSYWRYSEITSRQLGIHPTENSK